jgi:predicted DNA-binding transcriptional regulator AlpA
MDANSLELLRESDLRNRLKLSHSTIWRLLRAGQFPSPVRVSQRLKAWRLVDIERWLTTRAGLDRGQTARRANGEKLPADSPSKRLGAD